MKYYSTNGNAPIADLQKAVVKGLAEDRGLYMPEEIYTLPKAFINDMPGMKFQDIAYNVVRASHRAPYSSWQVGGHSYLPPPTHVA